MKLNETGQSTQTLKYAVEAYAIAGGSPAKLLQEAAEWLLDCYKKTADSNCIEAAGEIVKAYMEMGIYDREETVFDEIMVCLGTTRREEFPGVLYRQNCLKPTFSQIREILGRWPKTKSKGEGVEWVVKDIMERVKNQKIGCQYYRRGASGAVFELLVLDNASYLMDLEKKKVYFFDIQKG